MALDTAPLLLRQRQFAFKQETITGAKATLTATEGVTPVFNPAINAEIEQVERPGQGSISPIAMAFGARKATVEFETELYGSGTAGLPSWAGLLDGCGMNLSTATYAPKTGETQTITFGLYLPGRTKYAAGCMGTWTLTARRGQPARIKWSFTGVFQRPTSDTLATPTYDTTRAPNVGAATFTIGGTTYRVPEIEIDLGNQVILREDITAVDANSDPTGYRAAYITDRKTRIRISPESVSLATKDWYDMHRSGTTAALSLVIGSAANNTFTISCPKLQLVNPPAEADREGMMIDQLEFMPIRNTDAGEDDLTILFG